MERELATRRADGAVSADLGRKNDYSDRNSDQMRRAALRVDRLEATRRLDETTLPVVAELHLLPGACEVWLQGAKPPPASPGLTRKIEIIREASGQIVDYRDHWGTGGYEAAPPPPVPATGNVHVVVLVNEPRLTRQPPILLSGCA